MPAAAAPVESSAVLVSRNPSGKCIGIEPALVSRRTIEHSPRVWDRQQLSCCSVAPFFVAQIFNLPYRGVALRKPREFFVLVLVLVLVLDPVS